MLSEISWMFDISHKVARDVIKIVENIAFLEDQGWLRLMRILGLNTVLSKWED
jgi:hypothetical protein